MTDDTIELFLAEKLREIAEQIKVWERRDLEDQKARGDRKLSRPAYFHDLEKMAAMLEGGHNGVRLKASRSGRGRPASPSTVDRDMEIVRFMGGLREAGAPMKDCLAQAVTKYNVSEETAEAAWTRLRLGLEPGNEFIVPFFEKLRRRGMAKITRTKRP